MSWIYKKDYYRYIGQIIGKLKFKKWPICQPKLAFKVLYIRKKIFWILLSNLPKKPSLKSVHIFIQFQSIFWAIIKIKFKKKLQKFQL